MNEKAVSKAFLDEGAGHMARPNRDSHRREKDVSRHKHWQKEAAVLAQL